jgi:ABC-type metal ion transport system substrate-binding protein
MTRYVYSGGSPLVLNLNPVHILRHTATFHVIDLRYFSKRYHKLSQIYDRLRVPVCDQCVNETKNIANL